MTTRGLVAVLLFLTGFQSALAQKLKLYFSDKQVVEYSVEKVDSLVFTEDTADASDSHELVDLGLPSGTLWATCNVGANSPEEYGDYFAWGEIEQKSKYSWNTYKYCDDTKYSITKYCAGSHYGVVDNRIMLEAIDDAAIVNKGDEWQMPSREQYEELYNDDYTTTTWVNQNGVTGLSIISKTNGKSIFLPAAGYYNGSSLVYQTNVGGYWSRSLQIDLSYCAYSLFFSTNNVYTFGENRYVGKTIRPVRTNSAQTTVQKIVLYMEGNQTIECNASELDSIVFVDTEAKENDVHEYVDLGLPSGTLWATCNVGANSPEEYGDYFAWGETEPKSNYDWSTYKYCNGSPETMTKYCTSIRYGIVDNKTELEPSDDAATVNWGNDWQMPSLGQVEELTCGSYTNISWTTLNGVHGRKITSKSNGNSIFLPTAGNRHATSLGGVGFSGGYWSRLLDTGHGISAHGLYFCTSDNGQYYIGRDCGRSVRPVRVKN